MIIALCGNIASGKTTLAKKICSHYDYKYIPQSRPELDKLKDFFDDIPTNFFPVQSSFLISKAYEIMNAVSERENIVIDRSIFEDINVFAKIWMEHYDISQFDINAYLKLSSYIYDSTPKPDLYVYCKCEKHEIQKRLLKRQPREFEKKYPPEYLDWLCDKYDEIVFPNKSFVIEVNSHSINFTDDEQVEELLKSIQVYQRQKSSFQMSIFDDINQIENNHDNYPFIVRQNGETEHRFFQKNQKIKSIYIAAPFTEFATQKSENDEMISLIPNERKYDILQADYIRFLNNVKKTIEKVGDYSILLPHKDENKWGKKYISEDTVVSKMIENTEKCDMIIAIVSQSIGVHMEIAMMAVQKKPMVLIVVDDLTTGFYANGFSNMRKCLVKHVTKIMDALPILRSEEIKNFIKEELENE